MRVRRGQASDALNATALVHEAWLKLALASATDLAGRWHLLNVTARAMRQVVVDAARERLAAKRGSGAVAITLDGSAGEAVAAPMRDDAARAWLTVQLRDAGHAVS